MGVKRCVKTSGMNNNVLKQLFDKSKGSKFQNTDFQNFPLYFSKFPLYNVRGLGGHFPLHWSSEFIVMFLESVKEGEWENTQS